MENGRHAFSNPLRSYLEELVDFYRTEVPDYNIYIMHGKQNLFDCVEKFCEKETFILSNFDKYSDATYIRFYREIRLWLLLSLVHRAYIEVILERMDIEDTIAAYFELRYRIDKEKNPFQYKEILF